MKKKISFIVDRSSSGGAMIAASRIKKILRKNFEVDCLYSKERNYYEKLKILISKIISKLFIKDRFYLNSLNIFSRLNIEKSKSDLINIHWIGNEIISLNDLINTEKKIIWTMHDLWPLTSTEHFLINPKKKSYQFRDTKNNFLKKKIFIKKKKLFSNKNIFLVSNSKWLETFAKKSELTKNVKIRTIYNPIETNFWKRREIFSSKISLGLNIEKKYILFGAQGGVNNPRKGGELFLNSIQHLNYDLDNLEIIILGGSRNYIDKIYGIKCHFRELEKDKKKQLLYHSISSTTVSASKAESLPQFIVETILCKNPVATFNVGGINEIVTHKKNGYISNKISPISLANAISYCLSSINKKYLTVSENKLRKMFNENKIENEYKKLINEIYKK